MFCTICNRLLKNDLPTSPSFSPMELINFFVYYFVYYNFYFRNVSWSLVMVSPVLLNMCPYLINLDKGRFWGRNIIYGLGFRLVSHRLITVCISCVKIVAMLIDGKVRKLISEHACHVFGIIYFCRVVCFSPMVFLCLYFDTYWVTSWSILVHLN